VFFGGIVILPVRKGRRLPVLCSGLLRRMERLPVLRSRLLRRMERLKEEGCAYEDTLGAMEDGVYPL
jgi:hypothetical protein